MYQTATRFRCPKWPTSIEFCEYSPAPAQMWARQALPRGSDGIDFMALNMVDELIPDTTTGRARMFSTHLCLEIAVCIPCAMLMARRTRTTQKVVRFFGRITPHKSVYDAFTRIRRAHLRGRTLVRSRARTQVAAKTSVLGHVRFTTGKSDLQRTDNSEPIQ